MRTIIIGQKVIDEAQVKKYFWLVVIRMARRYPQFIIDVILDIILPNYNFLLEGPDVNYIDPKTGQSFNVLEYAQLLKNDTRYNSAVCNRIINYCNYRDNIGTVNEIIPMPIAEEIIPHILGLDDYDTIDKQNKS